MPDPAEDRPSVFPWPPVLLIASVAAAYVFDHWIVPLPIPFAETTIVWLSGLLLLTGGIVLVIWGALQFRMHRTTILPDRGASALIETGPFAFSRNPLYLGQAAILLGLALTLNRLSFAFVTPVYVFFITRLAILPEEAHLERRFGQKFLDYEARVRRWI